MRFAVLDTFAPLNPLQVTPLQDRFAGREN